MVYNQTNLSYSLHIAFTIKKLNHLIQHLDFLSSYLTLNSTLRLSIFLPTTQFTTQTFYLPTYHSIHHSVFLSFSLPLNSPLRLAITPTTQTCYLFFYHLDLLSFFLPLRPAIFLPTTNFIPETCYLSLYLLLI